MKRILTLTALLLLAPLAALHAATINLVEPLDYQVIQRTLPATGTVRLRGTLTDLDANGATWEARIVANGKPGEWQRVAAKISQNNFEGTLAVPAGGWYRLEVRVLRDGAVAVEAAVGHVGVGEVFVVAGQSNSANFGEEKQTPKTGRVAAFTGTRWQLADDPQPGAGGKGGSFMPPLGDEMVRRFNVPVGFIACGIGATSVREWLPKGTTFPNPPTLVGRVEKLPDGQWSSKGDAFQMFVTRMKQAGPRGFRAVLWHQGESDANQKDPTRTLPGNLYREYLEELIRDSRREIGWDAPWFVAQVSYHVPGDEASADIRAAQASLWKDGITLEGPDSDALKGDLRERGGKGVHFSGPGLRAHAAAWAQKLCPWLERECKQTKDEPNVGTGGGSARREVKLAAIFSSHMVLQREQPVPVWGWATPGEEVTVEFAGQKRTTRADADGKWLVKLDPLKVNAEPQNLKVNTLVIHDVLVGDVWLCSGQSNMAMTVDGKTGWLYIGGVANAKEEVRNSANPLLRQFYVDWKTDTKPQEHCTGKWTVAGPDTTANFTATGYFFARELQRRLQIPVGIISASFGGSSVEGWTSREALAKEADAEFVAKMNNLMDDYDNHDRLVTNYVAALAAWETKYDRADPGSAPNDNAADWKKVTLPASLAKLGCADGGVVWLRREIDVPVECGTAWRLDFPACRASYEVYLNGVKIFEATPANALGTRPARPTPGKGVARTGRNTLAIKLHAYSGASGITGGAFAVVPYNTKFQAVPLNGEWLCRAEKVFAPLPKDADPMPVAPVKGTLHWMPVPSQYNAMLHPLIPYAIKGVAWYQGESNVANPRYAKHLKILINDWRRHWGIGDFPFYLCQLPGFGARTNTPVESAWAECREAQAAAMELPNTGMANLIDTCEDGDLHPLNKQAAGQRLALVALANTYGVCDLAWTGPVFDAMKIEDGKAVITFKHAGDGLVARPLRATYHPNLRKPELEPKPLALPSPGSQLQGFTICDTTRHWVNAQAKIEGMTVVVWSDQVMNPIAVRYAWADHPVCNLYNQAGLPAFPFRTDKFPGLSEKNK